MSTAFRPDSPLIYATDPLTAPEAARAIWYSFIHLVRAARERMAVSRHSASAPDHAVEPFGVGRWYQRAAACRSVRQAPLLISAEGGSNVESRFASAPASTKAFVTALFSLA